MQSKPFQTRPLIFSLTVLVLLALACNISIDPGFDSDGSSSEENLQATEIALLQTQVAIEQSQQQQPEDAPQPEPPQDAAGDPLPEPPAQPETQPSPEGPAPNTVFGDISFYLDPAVAASASHTSVPAAGQEDPWGLPAHDRIDFTNYVVSTSFHEPRIIIFPIADYIARDEYVKEPRDNLQQLLTARPQDPGDSLPFLPFWNAGPLFTAQFSYVDFQNGAGIRYLTQHGQATWPINNEDMFYTYQGLTSDGLYYVSAILPVNHPILPANGDDAQITDWLAFDENFKAYTDDITQQLNSESDSMFTPSLKLLDDLFASLKVR